MREDCNRAEDLKRIEAALIAAAQAAAPYLERPLGIEYKRNGDPVTEAEGKINESLYRTLLRPDEGWLSEESADDLSRLTKRRVWIVDPIDGTKEFIAGIPEWCISVGLVEGGVPVAGGVLNPIGRRLVLGSVETGVTVNGMPFNLPGKEFLAGCVVLASRSEVKKGIWNRFGGRGYEIRPTGSIANKLASVASGLADATWTLVPKHEWDVAAGAALVKASGGDVYDLEGATPQFNRADPLLQGLIAHRPGLRAAVAREIAASRSRH
jgi:myo-inositol-1(or 4)-monophosphatase